MRRLTTTVLGLAATLVVASCGTAGSDPVTIDGLAAVASAAEAAGSARVEFRMQMTLMGQQFTVLGEGVSDTATGAGQMTMRGEGQLAEAIGENDVRTVGDTMYIRGPIAQQWVPGTVIPEGSWVAVDVSATMAVANQSSTANFQQMLDALRAAGADVEELGTKQLHGTTVRGVRSVATMRQLYEESDVSFEEAVEASLATQPPAQREAARELVREQLEAMMDVSVIVTAWVDDELLPRQLTMEMDLTEAMAAVMPDGQQVPESSMTMTFDILEYGVPVDVEAPPADSVVTAA